MNTPAPVLSLPALAAEWCDAGCPDEWTAPDGTFVIRRSLSYFDWTIGYCLELRSGESGSWCDWAFVLVDGVQVRWVEWATTVSVHVFDSEHREANRVACRAMIDWTDERLDAVRYGRPPRME